MKLIPFQEIETERLLLRGLTESDFENIIFLRSNELVNKFVKRPKAKNKKQALEFIKKINKEVANDKSCYWSISLKGATEMIGSISLWNFSEDSKTAEVGYDLKPNFHHKGIMNEAMLSVLDFGFKQLQLAKIEAFTHGDNESSKKLLLKQGFKLNPERKDKGNLDNIIFEIEK